MHNLGGTKPRVCCTRIKGTDKLLAVPRQFVSFGEMDPGIDLYQISHTRYCRRLVNCANFGFDWLRAICMTWSKWAFQKCHFLYLTSSEHYAQL